jgi:uncharacterized membrane protein YqaE (UPF0057 family)
MFKRFVICICNILFPPFAVYLLTGLNEDLILNCVLFLLAVIPSHVHGFYISLTYFNRKRKVKKGKYPGKPHKGIWSSKVNNGGASKRDMREMLEEKEMGPSRRREKAKRESGKPGLVRRLSDRLQDQYAKWDGEAEKYWDGWDGHEAQTQSPVSPVSSEGSSRRSWRSRHSPESPVEEHERSRRSTRLTQENMQRLSRQTTAQSSARNWRDWQEGQIEQEDDGRMPLGRASSRRRY